MSDLGKKAAETPEWLRLSTNMCCEKARGTGSTICSECESIETAYHLNSNKSVAVADDYYWNENMKDCPRGTKVQLLGAGGVAAYGLYFGDAFWESWAPLPKRRGKT